MNDEEANDSSEEEFSLLNLETMKKQISSRKNLSEMYTQTLQQQQQRQERESRSNSGSRTRASAKFYDRLNLNYEDLEPFPLEEVNPIALMNAFYNIQNLSLIETTL